ncbi:AraC family transcriptional regulator [Opitutus sp. ER46]|uniref:AraC family transcriptional regulator n=1 Tax=Opitutus sp. ER46 TaxID=2161864 RepID=UPI000D313F45|nr:AraC family transcriptional regulator [Opitutus sp. ER46]PTX91533.1 hypothetical protein DB354_16765 [Opitutus sp. ER46]
MLLTKAPAKSARAFALLAARARRLPSPEHPLHGRRRLPPPLPENIICFQRRNAAELNRPSQGRALHHRHVLIVPLQGAATVCVDDCTHSLHPGKGLVVLPYQFHHYTRTSNRRILWLFVTFEYAQGVTLEPLRNTTFNVSAAMADELRELLKDQRSLSEGGLPELRLALLLSQLTPPPAPGDATTGAGYAEKVIALKVNNEMQRRRPLAPTIRELASQLGMSQSHLRARFAASCGVSLGRHMRGLRLERACGLLRMSSKRVSEIAEQCGYGSVYSFSRAFHAAYGLSPRAYRNQMADAGAPRAEG